MEDFRDLKINVHTQGAPRVNQGWILREYPDLMVAEIDMHSKYHDVCLTGGDPPILGIAAVEASLHLHPDYDKEKLTVIEFPDFPGWSVWGISTGRYSICVTLAKDLLMGNKTDLSTLTNELRHKISELETKLSKIGCPFCNGATQ